MKSKRLFAGLTGISVFLALIFTFVWFFQSDRQPQAKELALDAVTARIDNKQVKEVVLKQSQVELTDPDNNKFFANVGSDATKEALVKKISDFNSANPGSSIKLTEQPANSPNWRWIFMLHLPNLIFFSMWALTLVVIVYAVRTLSRNKS